MKILGYVIFGLSGLAMFGFQLYWFHRWWGDVGVLAGLFIPPLVAAFPLLYLLKEGFSIFYFGIWLAGIGGMVLASMKKNQDEV
uniref:Uncharacterized protein n=1 Tax=Desulfomonile tiedjei TaxID=2358 RepID=A0A7C4AR32_9BACT